MELNLSIVIPAYLVENELERCVVSCELQNIDIHSYEIIIVNDGSPDSTLQVANKLAKKYSNITVINQENMGLGGARNSGLRAAKGKFIWFIDSDDYIVSNTLCQLIEIAHEDNLDCLFFQLKREYEESCSKKITSTYECLQPRVAKDIVLSGREVILQGYNPSSVCAIILKRNFLISNNLEFAMDMYHEDAEFTYRMLIKAERVKFITRSPYIYYTHRESMTQLNTISSIKKNKVDDVKVALSYIILSQTVSSDKKLCDTIIKRAKSILFSLLWEAWMKKKLWLKSGITDAIIDEMKKSNLYPLPPPYANYKQAIFSMLILNHYNFLK